MSGSCSERTPMPINQKQLHLICYDIANPRRLGRVHRYLSAIAIPVQYSVFLANIRATEISALITDLEDIIDAREDDVRIYPLPSVPGIERIGATYFPEGIQLLDGKNDLVALGKSA